MSEKMPAAAASNTYERIKRVNEDGGECWSGRDFARILGYTDYRNFEAVIEKARTVCLNSGQRVEGHFDEITEMIGIGKGGQRAVKTVLMSRHRYGSNDGRRCRGHDLFGAGRENPDCDNPALRLVSSSDIGWSKIARRHACKMVYIFATSQSFETRHQDATKRYFQRNSRTTEGSRLR